MSRPQDVFPPIWTIYDRPLDAPEDIVVRVWFGETPGQGYTAPSIEHARAWVRMHGACICLGRMPEDEPQIVESWV